MRTTTTTSGMWFSTASIIVRCCAATLDTCALPSSQHTHCTSIPALHLKAKPHSFTWDQSSPCFESEHACISSGRPSQLGYSTVCLLADKLWSLSSKGPETK